MLKALRVALVVYSIAGILVAAMQIFFPTKFADIYGLDWSSAAAKANAALTGFVYIAAAIFFIVAATNPLKHLLLVKYAIVFALLLLVGELYTVALGYVTFGEEWSGMAINVVFAALFLIFYPWKKPVN